MNFRPYPWIVPHALFDSPPFLFSSGERKLLFEQPDWKFREAIGFRLPVTQYQFRISSWHRFQGVLHNEKHRSLPFQSTSICFKIGMLVNWFKRPVGCSSWRQDGQIVMSTGTDFRTRLLIICHFICNFWKRCVWNLLYICLDGFFRFDFTFVVKSNLQNWLSSSSQICKIDFRRHVKSAKSI